MSKPSFPKPPYATGYCRHYSLARAALIAGRGQRCALGVDLSHPGSAAMCMPEPAAKHRICSKREEYTEAEHQAWGAFSRGLIERLSCALRALPAPVPPNTKGAIVCPNCGSQLHYRRWHRGAAIQCETENCASVQFSIEVGADWPEDADG